MQPAASIWHPDGDTAHDAISHLAADGFAVCDGASVRRALLRRPGRCQGLIALQRSFARLPADAYLAPERRMRFRRFSELALESASGRIRGLACRPFEQSTAVNPLYGGVARRFEPIEPALLDSPAIRGLIAHDHELLVCGLAAREPAWRVGLHQIRVVGTASLAGDPTPEGIHRDGHRFVAVHLLGRRNASGGAFRLHDDGHRVLFEHTARDLLDTVLLDDPRVKHSVTPIRPVDPSAGPAERDVLLVTWDPS
jgi:hypothetical protein